MQSVSLFRFQLMWCNFLLVVYCWTLNLAAQHIATNLQKCQFKTFCRLLQWIMGRMFSNKNVDIDLESFPLNPDSSEEMKGWGKCRRNLRGVGHCVPYFIHFVSIHILWTLHDIYFVQISCNANRTFPNHPSLLLHKPSFFTTLLFPHLTSSLSNQSTMCMRVSYSAGVELREIINK